MPLSFDPDFRLGEDHAPAVQPVTVITMADVPDGASGDVLVLWLLCDYNTLDTTAAVVSIEQADSFAANDTAMTVMGEAIQSLNAATMITAIGTRIDDLASVTIVLSPGSGPFGLVLGNFPPGTYGVLREDNYAYETELLSQSISVPGSGIFAGMMVSDENPGVGVTFPGGGDEDTATVISHDYEMVVWAYETGAADAQFDLTGDWITYDIVLGPPSGRKWWLGVAGWSGN